MASFRSMVSWLLPPGVHRAGPMPCCSVRTSSLEQSRVVNQTEYWLKYWYNDASEGDGEDFEVVDGFWEPPDEEDFEDITVTQGTVKPVRLGSIASQVNLVAQAKAKKDSVGDTNGDMNMSMGSFGLAQGMKLCMQPLVNSTITEKIPVSEEKLESEDYFSRLNSRIRTQLEVSFGHPPLKRENSEDADVEDNSYEESYWCETPSANLELYHLSTLEC